MEFVSMNKKIKFQKYIDSENYDDWVKNEINSYYYRICKNSNISLRDFYESSCFFFTMTFSTHLIHKEKMKFSLMNHDYSVEWDIFHYFYSSICSNIFGSKYSRSRLFQKLPFAFVAIDIPKEISSVGNIHIHGIWAWHPDELSKFNSYRNSWRYSHRLRNSLRADQVVFEPLDYERAKKKLPGSYVVKSFIAQKTQGTGSEMIRIYPNSNYSDVPYKANRKYEKFSRVLYNIRKERYKSRLSDEYVKMF